MGMYLNKRECINEVYFGQTPGITKAFEAFSAFRSKYVTSRKFFMGQNIDADHDPLLKKFIEEMEREFGFYSLSFVIINSDKVNAFTILPFFRGNFTPEKVVTANKDGYKFKKEAKISCITFAYTGLLFNDAFTDREIFSMMLHEIGHNFQDFIHKKMNILGNIGTVRDMICIISRITNGDILTPLKALLLSNKLVGKLSSIFNKISINDKRTIYSYFNFIKGFIDNVKTGVLYASQVILAPIMPIYHLMYYFGTLCEFIFFPDIPITGYMGEQIADRFASYYGFGPDLVTALSKFESNDGSTSVEHLVNNIPIVGHWYQMCLLPAVILSGIFDEHPATLSRVKDIKHSMEHDLKNPQLNPKLRKELRKEIDEIEKDVDTILNEHKKINDPFLLRSYYNAFVYNSTGGDLKYALSKGLFKHDEDLDSTYEKIKQNSEIKKVKLK